MVSRLRTSRDIHAGLVSAAIGAVLLIGALDIRSDPSRASVIGPAVFPIVISAAIIACALGLVVRGVVGPPAEPSAAEEPPEMSRQKLVVSFVLFAGYIVAFIPAGFLVSTIVFLTVLPTYIERGKVLRNAAFAVVFSVLVYLLFDHLLGVQVPPGNYTRS